MFSPCAEEAANVQTIDMRVAEATNVQTIEMRVTEAGPLGLCFDEAKLAADNGQASSYDWRLRMVRSDGPCAGRLQVGDELIAVNRSSIEGQRPMDVIGAMKQRPVDLVFWRKLDKGQLQTQLGGSAPSSESPRAAPEHLQTMAGFAGLASPENAERSAALLERLKMEVEVCSSEVATYYGARLLLDAASAADERAAQATNDAELAWRSDPQPRVVSWLGARAVAVDENGACIPEPRELVEKLMAMASEPSALGGNLLDAKKDEILSWIEAHDICFIQAATGMGKSTRIPQFVIDQDPSFKVWQLQPRRLAAKRLAEYLSITRGEEVGYRVRADARVGPTTRLTYMTTGYFLHFVLHHLPRLNSATVASCNWCTHLFVDEVHESNEETELCLLFVKMLSSRGKLPFKVVVLSATLDFKLYRDYFGRPEVSDDEVEEDPAEAARARPVLPVDSGDSGDSMAEAETEDDTAVAAFAGGPAEQTRASKPAAEAGAEDSSFSGPSPDGDTEEPSPPPAPKHKKRQVNVTEEDGPALGLVFNVKEDGKCPWTIRVVRPWSVAFGRVRVGDFLSEINDSPVSELSDSEVHVLLKTRPVRLHFVRPPRADPPKVAEELMDLAPDTPFPVEIIHLDEVHELGLPEFSSMNGPVPFNVSNHLRGLGPETSIMEICAKLLVHECCRPEDNALVFLPGISEIEHFVRILEKRLALEQIHMETVILHSITLAETSEVRAPINPTCPTAYVASSIAETSITLPELSVVFDFGLARGSVFDPVLEMEQLTTRLASQTSGTQRKGRVGRTKPGKVYRMYPRVTWDSMKPVDDWGAQQNLDRTILLVTRTLVRFLGLDVRELLRMLVQRPTEEQMEAAISRLEEMDALTKVKNGVWTLTAFGEFAVCISVLGPRLARLAYCGIIFSCTRMAIALAAIQSACGKGEIFQVPHDVMKRSGASEDIEIDLGQRWKDEFFFLELLDPSVDRIGIVFGKFHEREPGMGWRVNRVSPGGWAQKNGVLEDDRLNEIYTETRGRLRVSYLEEKEALQMLAQRPVTLFFERQVEVDPAEQRADDRLVWDKKTLGTLVNVAGTVKQYDDGYMSEPAVGLRLFGQWLKRRLRPEEGAVVSQHRLRQIDGVCREVSSKLRAMCKDAQVHEARRSKGAQKGRGYVRQRVLSRLSNDPVFWSCNYEIPLASQSVGWIGDLGSDEICSLRLVMCAAFPGNFLFGTLKPKKEKPARAETDTPPPPPPPDAPGVQPLPPPPPAAPEKPLDEEEDPPLTLRNAPPAFSADLISRMIAATYKLREGPLLIPAPGQRPGNWLLRFPHEETRNGGPAPERMDRVVQLGSVSMLNMLAQRDCKCRLQLFHGGTVIPCGELHVVPALEWRLMRMPQLKIKPAPKLTPLSRAGPAAGLGPPVPAAGPGREGARVAVAVELEAVRLNQKQGKVFRAGKAIRSWLVSWLPCISNIDLTLLLTFWSKEMILHEDFPVGEESPDATQYSAVCIGTGFTIRFPPHEPLGAPELKELRDMSRAVQHALRSGNVYPSHLPTLTRLAQWGRHVQKADIVTEEKPSMNMATAASQQPAYKHRHGFGSITLKAAPVRALNTLRGRPFTHGGKDKGSFDGPVVVQAEPRGGNFSRCPRPPRRPSRHGHLAEYWREAARRPLQRGAHLVGARLAPPPMDAECVLEPPRPPVGPPMDAECVVERAPRGAAAEPTAAAAAELGEGAQLLLPGVPLLSGPQPENGSAVSPHAAPDDSLGLPPPPPLLPPPPDYGAGLLADGRTFRPPPGLELEPLAAAA